ncbi:dATP/dGTP diphosphohydrolase domain-containing protein [Bradyrhizobium sp. 153]|uniref:dATP/dGTP diphosphohydrolase domain-containing protein n=1 Tax=Bradyrhizobium sp. 153 TaxID=2782627 RepID=UPI001FF7E949|nr:dATP/dGTP diphosphohydrolase domain-containing protein [Bradyrhizobium sp. 153]MCK1668646.1 hypothetical protein [Bradyrhizobium sp. 153]
MSKAPKRSDYTPTFRCERCGGTRRIVTTVDHCDYESTACPNCELAAGYPLRAAPADAPFVLQRDPGDEHAEGYHAHDRASRERDARRDTFTVPPGHEAVRDAEGRATGETRAKDCVTYCGAACTCGLNTKPSWPLDQGEAPAPKPEHDASTNAKPSNPKDAFGVLKAGISFVSLPVLLETAIGMAEGGFKYGAHNYRAVGVRASVYVDATFRHLAQFWEGEDIDPESGAQLSHITKAIASLTVLRDSMIQGNWTDDRPPPSPPGWLQKISAEMVRLADKFPQPVARYLANGQRGPGRILEKGE